MAVLGKVTITPKSVYSPSTTYQRLDHVVHNNSSWLALQETTGNTPEEGDYWTLSAQGFQAASWGDITDKPTTIEGYGITDAYTKTEIDSFNDTFVEKGSLVINVKDYGATGDGITDDTIYIQDAITDLSAAGGGTLYFPSGKYVISERLNISSPIMIIGDGNGEVTTNTNGTINKTTSISWNGSSDGMIYFSGGIGNYLFGGGIKNIGLHGNNIATYGVRGSSVGYMVFDNIKGRSFVDDFMLIDAENNVLSQFNVFDKIHYVWGTTSATENSNAVRFTGNASAGVTQNHIVSITGLLCHGNLIRFDWADNNIVEKAHASFTGTGKCLYFANGTGGNAADNVIWYCVGDIHSESNTKGNRIVHYISEGGGITVDSGAQLHYAVEDYVTKGLFSTHKYKMTDRLDIQTGAFQVIDGPATNGIVALQWACYNLADSANARIGANISPPYYWNNGTLKTMRVYFTTDTANTTANWVGLFRVMQRGIGAGLPTPQREITQTIPVSNDYRLLSVAEIPLDMAYTRDNSIFLSITRLPAHANDNALGDIQILSAQLIYQNSGPTSSGSGTYAVTEPGY